MRERLLDVLMYMFEHYIDKEKNLKARANTIASEMVTAGFNQEKVDQAILWFNDFFILLNSFNQQRNSNHRSLRVYTPVELQKINLEARGYLMYLEQTGVIDALSREMIIDRVMALDEPEIDTHDIKWVGLMVLFNQPDLKNQLIAMEDLVLNVQDNVEH